MAAPTAAPAARAALDQLTKLRPHRSRVSDGIMSSDAHKKLNPTSDHDKGDAFDGTNDPSEGVDSSDLAEWLRQRCRLGLEKRVKYIISDGRIASGTYKTSFWTWRKYDGVNGHFHHFHVSIWHSRRNQTQAWWTGYFTLPTPKPAAAPNPKGLPVLEAHNLGLRAKNGDVLILQKALNAEVKEGRLRGVDPLKQDAIFGVATQRALSQFQQQVQGWRAVKSPGLPVASTMTVLGKRRGFIFKA